MKKISTAGRRQIGQFAGQRLTIGLDLGDRSSWYCVLVEAGEVLAGHNLGQSGVDSTVLTRSSLEKLATVVPGLQLLSTSPGCEIDSPALA